MSFAINTTSSSMPLNTHSFEPVKASSDSTDSGIIFTNGSSTSGIIFTNGDTFDRGTFAASGTFYVQPLTKLPR